MRILVDADACPVKDIIVDVAKKNNIPVIMVCDTSHQINDTYSKTITVDKGKDSVDITLINLIQKDDIIVTQDYGLAALALMKCTNVINQNGLIYTQNNIDKLLLERHIGQKIRRSGKKVSSIKKRTPADNERFRKILFKILTERCEIIG